MQTLSPQPQSTAHPPRRGWLALAACVAVLTAVWGVVLPWLAETPPVRAMIDRNNRLGVDPSAMYYTDLEHLQFRDSMLRRIADPPQRDRPRPHALRAPG